MQNSYSFLVNLLESGSKKVKFKIGDGTQWEVEEYWTFLDNQQSSLLDSLGHVIIVKQKNHKNYAYSKKLEAYPLEQTEFTTIEKYISDSYYWFSVTYLEYDNAFRPNGKGSFEKILCKLIFTRIDQSTDDAQKDRTKVRRPSFKKRYNYSSLQNISSTDVKSITMQTAVGHLLQAIERDNAEMKDEAIEFIVKNFTELKDTELWKEFSASHRELKDRILDIIIEHMGKQSEIASRMLQKTVSERHM